MKPSLLMFLHKYHRQITGILIGLLVLGGFIVRSQRSEIRGQEDIKLIENGGEVMGVGADPRVGPIIVDIQGAVVNPGVYELTAGSRISNLLEAAGGFNDEVDVGWVEKNLNLASKLEDEDKIYVPDVSGAASNGAGRVTSIQREVGGKININTATAAQLETLPGIGPSKATSIIVYREQNGRFKSVNELINVSGIGEKTLEKIRELVVVR